MSDETGSLLDKYLPKIARGGGIVLAGMFFGKGITYLFRLIVARSLEASTYGLISLGMGVLAFAASLSRLGLQAGVTRFVSLYRGKENRENIRGVFISSFKLALPVSFLLASLLWVFSNQIATSIFHEPKFSSILKLFSIGIPLSVLSQILYSGIQGFQRMDYQVYSKSLTLNSSRFLLAVIALFLGLGAVGVSIAYTLSFALSALVAFYLLQEKLFPVLQSESNSPFLGKKLLFYSLPLMLSGFLMTVLGETDTVMLGYFKTSANVGLYNAARPTAKLSGAFTGAIGMIFFPILTEFYGRERKKEMRDIIKRATKWILIGLTPITLGLISFPRTVIKFLFGPNYGAAAPSLSILAVGFFILHLFMPSRKLLQAIGRTNLMLLTSLIAAGTNVMLNYFLIPPYGIEGAAIATTTSVSLAGLTAGFLAAYKTGFYPFKISHIRVLLSGLLGMLSLFLLSKFISTPSTFIPFIIALLVFLLLYTVLLLILGSFDKRDLIVIEGAERKLGINLELVERIIKRFL